jgi:superfamily II DNA or RNA helicase
MELWENQKRALAGLDDAEARGVMSAIVTAPTGGGKTEIMAQRARITRERGKRTLLFTNRKLLTSQAAKTMGRAGLNYGVYAAGWDQAVLQEIQVVSLQTLHRRIASGKAAWPPADEVIIDEAHSCKGPMARAIIAHYKEQNAFIWGATATPVNLKGLYEEIIVAGTKAELRQAGALVPCTVFAPDEPDLRGVKKTKVGEYDLGGQIQRIMRTICFGDVFAHWKRLNPNGLPTILWAPGVAESRWFQKMFEHMGVRCAHIDAATSDEEREQIFSDNEIGHTPVITSMGICREGVDLPWLYHGILVQPCLFLSTYLQIVGRLLRAYDGKTKAILQDHAGAWWRHGSPNADHQWRLGKNDRELAGERQLAFEYGDIREPIRCPRCSGIRMSGPRCPHCGYEHTKSVRAVRMDDGSLTQKEGNAHKHKDHAQDDQRNWIRTLFANANAKFPRTVLQAAGTFKRRFGKDLPLNLKHIPPPDSIDWKRHVNVVFPWLTRKKKGANNGQEA